MENQPARSWYKKKRYVIPAALLGLILISSLGSSTSPQPSHTTPAAIHSVQQAAVGQSAQINNGDTSASQGDNLSNNNYYVNSAGNTVHSPAYSDSVPTGATAQCRDGTYSFSQSRRGTCSHHGGVLVWAQ